MVKHLIEALLALAVIVLLATVGAPVGWRWWVGNERYQTTDDSYVQGDLRTLSPKVPGYVAKVLVGDYQTVSAGQPILQIEDDDYRANVDLARGVVDSKQAAIDTIDAQIRQQQNLIAQAAAQVKATEANLELAHVSLDRARALLKDSFGTRVSFDQATATMKSTTASLQSNMAALEQARGQVGVLSAQKKQAEADLIQAKAQLQLATINLDHTVIRAPVGGRLGKRGVFEGQYVSAGTAIIDLTPLDTVWVAANFKETQLARIRPGLPVVLTVDGFPGVRVEGHVEQLAPASGSATALLPPDNATGNFTKIVQRVPLKITLDPGHNLDGQLLPGMSTIATVDTQGVIRVGRIDAAPANAVAAWTPWRP